MEKDYGIERNLILLNPLVRTLKINSYTLFSFWGIKYKVEARRKGMEFQDRRDALDLFYADLCKVTKTPIDKSQNGMKSVFQTFH